MEKSTKLIIAAIGLGGLGYFLYKRGMFTNSVDTSEMSKAKIEKDLADAIEEKVQKPAVEPPEKEIVLVPDFEEKISPDEPYYNPKDGVGFRDDTLDIPSYNNPFLYDNLGFRDNTYFDQPAKIDYSAGKYNQEVPDYYMGRDMVNDRLNQYLYA